MIRHHNYIDMYCTIEHDKVQEYQSDSSLLGVAIDKNKNYILALTNNIEGKLKYRIWKFYPI